MGKDSGDKLKDYSEEAKMKRAQDIGAKYMLMITIIVVGLAISLAMPAVTAAQGNEFTMDQASDSDGSLVPAKIDGTPVPAKVGDFPVIFVERPENCPWMVRDKVILVLQGPPDLEKALSNPALPKAVDNLPSKWSVKVVGGPNFTIQGYLDSVAKNMRAYQEYGPLPQGGLSRGDPRTYACCCDKDPHSMDIDYLGATWEAPTVGYEQDEHSLMTLVGKTYWAGDFIQTGQWYQNNGVGRLGYTTNRLDYYPEWYDKQYYPGHMYYNFISNCNITKWYVGVQDLTAGDEYEYKVVWAAGEKLDSYYENNDFDTGVFFENFNSNQDWYSGFSDAIEVRHALEKEQGSSEYLSWQDEVQVDQIVYEDGTSPWWYDDELNYEVIDGTLINDNTTEWDLSRVWVAP